MAHLVIGSQWVIKMPIYYSPETKGFYDTDSVVYRTLPESLIEVSVNERNNLVRELNSNNKVIVIVNDQIILQDKPTSLLWDNLRVYRNILLKESDYTQLPDFPPAKKTEWATYRQALRDIPQTYTTPEEVIWPTKPA